MKHSKNTFNTSLLILAALLFSFLSCAKMKSPVKNMSNTDPITEIKLKSTELIENSDTQAHSNTDYEPLPTEIKTKTATLKLGLTKFSDMNYTYDSIQNKLAITGHLQIYDQDKKIQSDLDFELNGNKNSDQSVVDLNQKKHTKITPVIRAKVTCLGLDSNEELTCDKVIVDFFIFYKNQYMTDQFETEISLPKKLENSDIAKSAIESTDKSKTDKELPAKSPLEIEKPIQKKPENIESLNEKVSDYELQTEGAEDSQQGRYQGQVENTNVVEFLQIDLSTAIEDKTETIEADKNTNPAAIVQNPEPIIKPAKQETLSKSISEMKTPIEKNINNDVKQTAHGILRTYNQSVGYPDKGSLRNATSLKETEKLLKDDKYFSVAFQSNERFYGTFEMSKMMTALGQFLYAEFDHLKLYVGDISAKHGGRISPHQSHQIGMDVDLAYPTKTTVESEKIKFPVVVAKLNRQLNKSAYSAEKTFKLFKFAFKQTQYPVDRIFVDRLIIKDLCNYATDQNEFKGKDKELVQKLFQNIEHIDGHGDHFHMRLKCTDSQPTCRSKNYKKILGCEQAAR